MGKLMSVAIAAMILLAGSSAGARTVSSATLTGDFNDSPYDIAWTAKIEFDPTRGTLSAFEDGYQLLWESGDAGPSPVSGAYVELTARGNGDPGSRYNDLPTQYARWAEPRSFGSSNFTSFALRVSTYHYAFELVGPDISLEIGSGVFFGRVADHPFPHFYPLFAPGGVPPVDGEVDLPFPILGDYGDWSLPGALSGGPLTRTLRVDRVAVPEPSSWALMILGFGSAGAALRRQRRPVAHQ